MFSQVSVHPQGRRGTPAHWPLVLCHGETGGREGVPASPVTGPVHNPVPGPVGEGVPQSDPGTGYLPQSGQEQGYPFPCSPPPPDRTHHGKDTAQVVRFLRSRRAFLLNLLSNECDCGDYKGYKGLLTCYSRREVNEG